MKHQTEIMVSIIGVLLFVALLASSIWMFSLEGSPERLAFADTFSQSHHLSNHFFIYLSAISGVWVLCGIAAVLLLKKAYRVQTAGCLLVIAAIFGTLSTVGFGIFSSLIYLIAGVRVVIRQRSYITGEGV
ncbi:DUF4064 domain-containing protein [Gracilibacillus timonensis]|uniref:DUF4064 domain-containing protein n=1 Tax=Gracilibacillus timonensis TaxID=1816696 RepID=UPI000824FD6D|nr:DUF4064 domain-containing protein [Gracilibacillus timonensis]